MIPTISSKRHGIILAAALVCVGCSNMGGEGLRDSIANQIDKASIGKHAIGIEVRSGVVTLDGTVSSDAARRTVEEIATNMPGVESVQSALTIAADSSQAQPELAKTVWSNLQARPGIGTYQISILAKAGVVTLSGTAGSIDTRTSIEQIARATSGVVGVKNQIEVLR